PHDRSCIHYIAFCSGFQAGLPKWAATRCQIFVKSTVHLVETMCVRRSDRAKVPPSWHVQMGGTHTGKFSAESVRAALRRVRGSALNFVPGGILGGRNF